MRHFFVAAAICSVGIVPAFGQECRQLAPVVIRQIDGIGGNHCLRSPNLLSAAVGDKLAASRWPKYTRAPSNECHTGLYLNYNFNVLERTERSNNGWSANPLQFFPELRQFCANYSQNASDVRTRYVCGIEIWGILDTTNNDGRVEIARGRGGSAGAFEYIPFQGGSSYVSVSGGSHNSSHSSYQTNPLSLQGDELMKEAVGRMFLDLEASLHQGGYSFSPLHQQPQQCTEQPSQSVRAQFGPPEYGGPAQFGGQGQEFQTRLTASQLAGARQATALEVYHQSADGTRQTKISGIRFRIQGATVIYTLPWPLANGDGLRFYK